MASVSQGSIASLAPPAEFDLPVMLPRPGLRPAVVVFRVPSRRRSELVALVERVRRMPDADAVLAIARGWALSDEFTPANVREVCELFPGCGVAVLQTYLDACYRPMVEEEGDQCIGASEHG